MTMRPHGRPAPKMQTPTVSMIASFAFCITFARIASSVRPWPKAASSRVAETPVLAVYVESCILRLPILPAAPRSNHQCAAVHMQGLAGDVAPVGPAEQSHHGGNILRPALPFKCVGALGV